MNIFDRYKYIKEEENKEEYQRERYIHKFIESYIPKKNEMEYKYFSVYRKQLEKDNKVYDICIY